MTDKENTDLTLKANPQKPHGVYPETQTYTPHSETESVHTHPMDFITAVSTSLSHIWTNDLPRELEKDGENEAFSHTAAVTFDPTASHTLGNPDDNTAAYLNLNTLGTDSKEIDTNDESNETIENDEDGDSVERLHTEDEHKNEEVNMSQANHVPVLSTPPGAATNQILFRSVTLSLPEKQNTVASPTPTQLSLEDNRDESREKTSREDEEITEALQATTLTKVTKFQAELFEMHTPATTHTHTTTQQLSGDKDATNTESKDKDEHSSEDNQQMGAEIQNSNAGHTAALNTISLKPITSHLLPKNHTQHIEVKAPITPSQATLTLSPKTTHFPVTHQTSQRHTTFTKSSYTSYTSHTLLPKPTFTPKSSVTLRQNPGSAWRVPITHNHQTEPRPLHTPKPSSAPYLSATTTQGYSEEEEEEREEKYKDIKKELLDSSQEAESKSKSKTIMLKNTSMDMSHVTHYTLSPVATPVYVQYHKCRIAVKCNYHDSCHYV